MKNIIAFSILILVFISSCTHQVKNETSTMSDSTQTNKQTTAKNSCNDLSCKLTSAEMQKRRTTVLESLRKQILEKKELTNGFAFRFEGNDSMFDELTAFIKTERECCSFFSFNLSVGGDKKEIWMEITGPKEAKEFIKTEMEL